MLVGGVPGVVATMHDRGQVPLSLVVLVAALLSIANSIAEPFGTMLNTALYYDRRAHADELDAEAAHGGVHLGQPASLAPAPSR
jgi:hypothetical protein